jgi:hypothetical protein
MHLNGERLSYEELEELIFQYRDLLFGKKGQRSLKLSPQQAAFVRLIAVRGPISCNELLDTLALDFKDRVNPRGHIGVQIYRARKALAEKNIKLKSRASYGYWFEKEEIEKLKAEGLSLW